MFTRFIKPPSYSAFLLGPRGTGKSTWLNVNFPKDSCVVYDLLDTQLSLQFLRDPGRLFQECNGLPQKTWVVIDEIQKVPALLDEVHRLIENNKIRFILSGSSARRIRRAGVNLLAGRALELNLFPLVSKEVDFKLNFPDVLESGMLPMAFQNKNVGAYLSAYVNTYLSEEIKAEALTRNVGSFSRFLEVASRQNGQVTSFSSISRDAQVARQTVQTYFEILEDTLIGFWLTAWKLKSTTKQIQHPKFYFFDCGVVRALSARSSYPLLPEETGHLLETFMIAEIRAFLKYHGLQYPLHFWSSYDRVEADLFFETKNNFWAVEIKSSKRWEPAFNKGFYRLKEEVKQKPLRCVGVYLGERTLQYGDISVLPCLHFLKELWKGNLEI